MKIYISGPITGERDYLEAFARAEKELKAEGNEIINPAEIMKTMPITTTHRQYMDISIVLLSQCDAIYMLKGWKRSTGAQIEWTYAMNHLMPIFYEGQDT